MEDQYDEKMDEQKEMKTKTPKEIKAMCRPEFEANPDKFYPTNVFKKIGYHRAKCPLTGRFFWRHSEKQENCGDAQHTGSYTFIGDKIGIGKEKYITYADAWKTFEDSFTTARIPSSKIDRYPVVARWRNDVDYVAAGIYCFQPYCVTGELDPPANPLICPQFCVRFNDLDNIGITGRHYSGFIMMGLQVFNYPDKYVFFKEEMVEFIHRWLTEGLKIDPDEITYLEDVWAGGGNCGPSIEFFIRGMEVGNIVFMQYKTFHDGTREDLPIKIIDFGGGLERVSWLLNGKPTSYIDTFKNAFDWVTKKLEVSVNNDIWSKFGPLSCQLDIDEVEDLEKTWGDIAKKVEVEVSSLKEAITEAREVYILLDHTRTLMMIIQDGSLPSNSGGGGNVRNMLRRVFSILKKNGWWDKIGGVDGICSICDCHKEDLGPIYGKFPEYKSFKDIIQIEYDRWTTTDVSQKQKLEKLIKKNPKLSIDDWITAMSAWGIPADVISQISNTPIPGNLWYEITQRQESTTKAAEQILYNTTHLQETKNIFYDRPNDIQFEGKILDIFANVKQKNARNLVILDQSLFYPTSGGQANDIGTLTIEGEKYNVINCEKVGKCVLHVLEKPVPNEDVSHYKGMTVQGEIDLQRRTQLRNHHTATHIVFASCRAILGPHVWQAGAKKTINQAHLDITHYDSLTKDQEIEIENHANRIILLGKNINKGFMDKAQAELDYGFRLYQGGVVPGNQLRVVNIDGIDVEACCGTHCDNTSQVGWIKLLKTSRIADGTVRLYFVAGEKTIQVLNQENIVLNRLQKMWSVNLTKLEDTAERFFKDSKRLSTEVDKQNQRILGLQVNYVISNNELKHGVFKSDQPNATLYFSFLGAYAPQIKQSGKGIIFVGDNFIYGISATKDAINIEKLKGELLKKNDKPQIKTSAEVKCTKPGTKEKIHVKDVQVFSYIGTLDTQGIIDYFVQLGVQLVSL